MLLDNRDSEKGKAMFQSSDLHGLSAKFNHRIYGDVSGVIVKSHIPLHAENCWTVTIFSAQTGMLHEVNYFNCKIDYFYDDEQRRVNLIVAHEEYSVIMAQSSGLWFDRIQNGYRFW